MIPRPTAEEVEAAYRHWRILRFWSYVEQRGPDECWPWHGGKDTKGYGTFCLHSRKIKAHRLICELIGRPIPAHLVGMHSCDNHGCVNPAHVSGGTNAQNIRDAYARGLVPPQTGPRPQCRGENSGRCKYSDAIIEQLRSRYGRGEKLKDLAQELGISYTYASRLNRRHNRKEATHVKAA